MFTAVTTPVSRFMAPLLAEASRDAIRHAATSIIAIGGVAAIGLVADTAYRLGCSAGRQVRLIPRPHVTITWDRNWDTKVAAPAAVPPVVDGAADPADA
jgi:hypothetical protein